MEKLRVVGNALLAPHMSFCFNIQLLKTDFNCRKIKSNPGT
jgi:hypothetical protein